MQIVSQKISSDLIKKIQEEVAEILSLPSEKIMINWIDVSINENSFNLSEIEKITLIKALAASSGNISKTSLLLGITRRTVYALIKKYSIEHFLNTHDK